MKFVDVLGNGELWSVIYPSDDIDILTKTFREWTDIDYLDSFFRQNFSDLVGYYKISNIDTAIFDTIEDAYGLRKTLLSVNEDSNLDLLFHHLENYRFSEVLFGREKAKGRKLRHDSWLRLYALKIDNGVYLITGGTIKLTHTMAERKHTIEELNKMEKVRNFLIGQGVTDLDGFNEL